MRYCKQILILLFGTALLAPFAGATQTAFWEMGTFHAFLQGQLEGVSVSMSGQLKLAPEMRPVFNPGETVALSVAADHRGNLYIGTGHEGKVFVLDSQMQGKLLFQAPEPEILALAVGPDHDLYVGSSPEGKIYRVTPDGKSSVFYNPKVKYIWSLAFDSQGRLYAGTGDRGQIMRIDPDGRGEVFFASDQTHIMCLVFDNNGNLLAGSEPGGLVYRITPDEKAFVLYQANLPEIHALATDSEGHIYAAALGGMSPMSVPGGYPAGASGPVVAGTTTVTVVAGSAAADPPPQTQRSPSRGRRYETPAPGESAGIGSPYHQMAPGRGELIEILPNYSAQTLWASDQASIFGLATRGNHVLFSTDSDGYVFDLLPSPSGTELTLLTETRESLPTRILTAGHNLFIATSNIAKVIQVGANSGGDGTYESPVKDTHFVSHWGQISWNASVPAQCSLALYTRSGNSSRPDNTWSDWSGPYENPDGTTIQSTPARYIQWKAVFHGAGGGSPALREVTLAYLNQNLPPEIHLLTIVDGTEKVSVSGAPDMSSGMAPAMEAMSSVPAPTVSTVYETTPGSGDFYGENKPPITIEWQASDPNHDHLTYYLYLKSSDEDEWHLLQGKVKEENFSLQPDSLANGEYRVRVVASDEASNSPSQALKSDLISAPFWIDNTPPEIQLLSQQVHGQDAVIRFKARSQAAPLKQAEISDGGNNWHDILSDDGIVDAQKETFTVTLHQLSAGEHVVSLRAFDTAGNVGVGKAVIHVQ